MKCKSYRKHFTSDLARKGENPKYANPWTFRDFEDTLGIFTMYRVIPRVSIQATIVDFHLVLVFIIYSGRAIILETFELKGYDALFY